MLRSLFLKLESGVAFRSSVYLIYSNLLPYIDGKKDCLKRFVRVGMGVKLSFDLKEYLLRSLTLTGRLSRR